MLPSSEIGDQLRLPQAWQIYMHAYWRISTSRIKRRESTVEEEEIYQKAVKSKKLEVEAMEAIEPAAKKHCEILRTSPVKVPGVPGKSFIFCVSKQRNFKFLIGRRNEPSFAR